MRRELDRSFAILGLVAGLAVPAIAGNHQQPAPAKPAPAPAARPAPAPAHPVEATARPIAAHPIEVAAKPAPAAAEAKSSFEQPPAPVAARTAQGGDAKPPPPPPDRVQKEREAAKAKEAQEKEKERIEKAREQEKAKEAAPAKPGEPARGTPGNAAEQREVAKKAAHFEQRYRNVQARLDRLIRIYKAKGDNAKVATLEQWKAREEKRKANAMEGFRKQMSSENWGKLNSEMEKQHAQPARATATGERPAPATPPKSGG
jgi:hypothetical protein